MNFEFDLTEGLKDPAKARATIASIQKAIDELVLANKEVIKAAEDANKVAKDYEKQLGTLTQTNLDLADTLKSIHIVLGSKKDLWKDDNEMNELTKELAMFVMSSGAIKAGVFSEARSNS